MKIESYGASDIGLVRLNNEDVWAQLPKEQLYILADGMGGHNAGEVAANETVLLICRLIKENYDPRRKTDEWSAILLQAIQKANSHILTLAAKDRTMEGMGTTLCLVLFVGKSLVHAHVGDSRIYRVRKGRLTQLTRDHSLRDDLIATGELDESLALSFPYKNVITRAIGTHKLVNPDIANAPIESGDVYFLCSDGLTDALSDAQIHDIIDASDNLHSAVETLIIEAKKSGGNDNITILMLKVS